MESTLSRNRVLRQGRDPNVGILQPRAPGARSFSHKLFLLFAALILGFSVLIQYRPAAAQPKSFGMDVGYSYMAAPSWPDSFPYGVFLGLKYGERLKLGGALTVYLSPEYSLESTYPWQTLSAGKHVSEHVVLLLATADYDILPRDEYRFVPFVSLGAGLFYGDVTFAEANDPQPGIETAIVTGEDEVNTLALRAGVGLRRCFAVTGAMWGRTEPCLSARVDYLWAQGTMLRDTANMIHGNLGGFALGLAFGF